MIAGYPWFLDWGRDSLICVRGLIAAGRCGEARGVLQQFARFEDRGTLPNMIRGERCRQPRHVRRAALVLRGLRRPRRAEGPRFS